MKNPSMKNFIWEVYYNNKTKSENTLISHVRHIACIDLLACVPVCARAVAHVLGNSVNSVY